MDVKSKRRYDPILDAIFAAELFSHLSPEAQTVVIDLIKSLLSD